MRWEERISKKAVASYYPRVKTVTFSVVSDVLISGKETTLLLATLCKGGALGQVLVREENSERLRVDCNL